MNAISPLSKEHMQLAREALAECGIEMTPQEFDNEVRSLLAKVRASLRARGMPAPGDDPTLFMIVACAWEGLEER